jgi:curli biogenesis system outer membrane secretion channel CsgG
MRINIMKKFVFVTVICFFLNGCAAAPPAPSGVPSEKKTIIAIWDLEDLSPMGIAQPDMGNILSARIMETIQQAGDYTVVEREKLEIALRELNLGSSSLADPSTQLRIGRIAGAKLMIFGAYQVIADQMRLDLRMVDVETGRIKKTAEKTAGGNDISGWLNAAEAAAKELI